jgi:hypothetical protein
VNFCVRILQQQSIHGIDSEAMRRKMIPSNTVRLIKTDSEKGATTGRLSVFPFQVVVE